MLRDGAGGMMVRDGMSVEAVKLILGGRTPDELASSEEMSDGVGIVTVPCLVDDDVTVWFVVLIECGAMLVVLTPGSETDPVGPAVDVAFVTGKWVGIGSEAVSDMPWVGLG